MLHKPVWWIASGVLIAGCSLPDMREEPDVTPMHPTAVFEMYTASDGLKGFVPFESTTKRYTRANMQREDTNFKGTGSISGWLMGSNDSARIERLDRKLLWTLNQKGRTYTECPLKGCSTPAPSADKPQDTKSDKPGQSHEPECRMKIAGASFSVKPTGEKRAINGFSTDAYQVAWVITFQDQRSRKTVSTLNVDIWATPGNRELHDAMAVEQTYAHALSSYKATTNADKLQVVPAEASRMITAYLGSMLTASDQAALFRSSKELDKIKGYPILSTLTWDLRGEACAAKDGDTASASSSDKSSMAASVKDAMSGVTDWFSKKMSDDKGKEAGAKPILVFTTEVKSHRIEQVRDGTFAPPPTYKLAAGK